jgi:hypothetical protein
MRREHREKKLMRYSETILHHKHPLWPPRSFLFSRNSMRNTETTLPSRTKSVNNLRIDFSNNMKFHFSCPYVECDPRLPFYRSICSPDSIKNSKNTFSTCLMGLCHFNIKNESNNAFIHVL